MNHFISGIIKIIILEAQVGLLLFDAVVKDRFAKQKKAAFIVLSAAMVAAWCNYGAFTNNGLRLVHHWEQFHFYLGAKYQAEVGWFDLYRAAVLADAETAHALKVEQLRNNETFELEPVSVAFAERERIVGRFTPERWEQFKRDWLLALQQPVDWNRILQDHGNSNSPAWALIAHPIASIVPYTPDGQMFIGWLDMVLMGVMWWFVWKTFDWKVTSIGMLMWAAQPHVFDYLAGSFLRWDWLFCLGMTVCFMKRERWLYAGLFFGFAVATKLFPLWFGVALLMRAGITMWRDKKVHLKYRQFAMGTVATGLAAVLLSSAMFGGFWVWGEYKRRIDAAVHERFYNIQYSLKTVYLQVEESTASELAVHWLFPAEMKQQRNDVNIEDHRIGLGIVQLLFTLLVLLLVLRTDDIGAFTLGPMLVFTWLTVNMYYWNMFGLLALGLARREGQKPALGALMALHAIFMGYYLYVHTNHGFSEGYMVALQLCLWLIGFAWFEYRVLKAEMTDLVGMLYGRKRA